MLVFMAVSILLQAPSSQQNVGKNLLYCKKNPLVAVLIFPATPHPATPLHTGIKELKAHISQSYFRLFPINQAVAVGSRTQSAKTRIQHTTFSKNSGKLGTVSQFVQCES